MQAGWRYSAVCGRRIRSPDLTVAVIEDVGAEGPLTDVILGVTIVKDIIVIVLFTIVLAFVGPVVDPSGAGGHNPFREVGLEVGGAVVAGALLGWLFSLYLQTSEEQRSPLATFLFTYILVVIAEALHLELLILAASAGFVIENLSPAGDRMIRGIASVSVVVFAFFFAVAGASLDVGAVSSVEPPACRIATCQIFARIGRVLTPQDPLSAQFPSQVSGCGVVAAVQRGVATESRQQLSRIEPT